MTPPIELEGLERLTQRLQEALAAYKESPDNLFVLDSVIKRFELCYLQTVRLIERFLKDNAPVPPEDDATFREVVEQAIELGLTRATWTDWLQFRKARNQTAHTYMEEIARNLVGEAELFLPEALFVLNTVARRVSNDA